MPGPIHMLNDPNRVPDPKTPARPNGAAFQAVLQQASAQQEKRGVKEEISQAIAVAAEKYRLPPALIMGVIQQESGFNPRATSWCGAQGLMQLMPGTAKNLGVTNSYDIQQNIDGGAKYLRQMLDQFGGNVRFAIAAYNAGPGAVSKYGGIPPYKETQDYVPAVLAHYAKFNNGSVDFDLPGGPQRIDPTLIASTLESIQLTNQTMVSAVIAANPPPLRLPERTKVEEPPPPPPPHAVRV